MTSYLSILDEYVAQVLAGTQVANKYVVQACERHRRDCDDERFAFDVDRINKSLAFIETLPYPRGDRTGEPIELLPWQVFVFGSLLGWRYAQSGEPRYKFAILELARGQGKTVMMAALLADRLINGSEGDHLYSFGSALRVSALVFEDVRAMLLRLGEDTGTKIRPRRTIQSREYELGWREIRCRQTGSKLEPLVGKEQTLDGLDPACYIADEVSEFSTNAFEKLYTSTIKRKDALGVCITTPGSSDQTLYFDYRRAGLAVLNQEHDDPGSFYYICGIEPDDDPEDTTQWQKAMPSLGRTVQLSEMQRRLDSAKLAGPSHVLAFRRFHLCEWVGVSNPWIDIETFDKNKRAKPDLRGRRAWAGLDLSKSRDMSSLVAVVETDDGLFIEGHHYYPQETAEARQGAYRMPLLDWGRAGHLNLVPGAVIDYEAIYDKIVELNETYALQAVWADPLMVGMIEQKATAAGIPFGCLKQSITYLSPGTILAEEMLVDGRLQHDGDPVLRAAMQNAKVYIADINQNRRLDKKRSDGLIDPAMALIFAISAYTGSDTVSVFEDRDLRVF